MIRPINLHLGWVVTIKVFTFEKFREIWPIFCYWRVGKTIVAKAVVFADFCNWLLGKNWLECKKGCEGEVLGGR